MIMYAQARYNALNEATMGDFKGDADSLRLLRSKSLRHYYKDIGVSKDGHAIVHLLVPSGTDGGKEYDVYIEFMPANGTLFSQSLGAKTSAKKIDLFRHSDVKVFCSCPDFNWSGMKYNMKHIYDSYLSGYESVAGVPKGGEDIPPKVRDPEHNNKVCKHLLAAFRAVLMNWNTIIRDIRNYKAASSDDSHIITTNPKVQFQDNPL